MKVPASENCCINLITKCRLSGLQQALNKNLSNESIDSFLQTSIHFLSSAHEVIYNSTYKFIFFTLFLLLNYYRCLHLPLCPHPPSLYPLSFWPLPHCVCVCGLQLHGLWLTPSPSFIHSLSPLSVVRLFHLSIPLFLFLINLLG